MTSSSMRNPTVRRWAKILMISGIVLVLFAMLRPALSGLVKTWHPYFSSLPPLARYSATLLGVVVVSLALIRVGALGARFTVKTILRYPPIWLSALIPTILMGFTATYQKDRLADWILIYLRPTTTLVALAFLGALIAFAFHGLEQSDCSRSQSSSPTDKLAARFTSLSKEDLNLLTWVMEERPIRVPDEDMLGHVTPAKRIARLLSHKKHSNVGIVAPYGSGKTSIVNLVEYYLDHPETLPLDDQRPSFSGKIVRCRFDGWGRGSGTIAQQILARGIGAIKPYVDCSSVIALPENYHKAVSGVNSALGAFMAELLQTSQDPESQLHRLDNILAAANLRLVIILEDLDRNLNDQAIREEMPGLLDRLRGLHNVGFVLAIGTERQFSEILIRICEHVEAVS